METFDGRAKRGCTVAPFVLFCVCGWYREGDFVDTILHGNCPSGPYITMVGASDYYSLVQETVLNATAIVMEG